MRATTIALALLSVAIALKLDVDNPHDTQVLLQNDHRDMINPETPEVFPVPTASRCVVLMVCQYMIIYTALAVSRTVYGCFYSQALVRYKTRGLAAAAQTMTYAPMLCVLFIACRMRVEFLSKGKGQPQSWVQNCMYALTFSVLASSLVVLLMPLFSGKPVALKEGSCDLEKPHLTPRTPRSRSVTAEVTFYILTAVRYLILLGLYGGMAGVIVGINIYLPPGETDLSKVPAPAPAIMCTMILSVVFFLTQLIIALCQTYTEFMGVDFYAGHIHKVIQVMNAAASTVEFAPMVAIVFLAARMRALQHNGQPQEWAQNCMYGATGALCLTTLMAIVVPMTLGGTMKTNPATNEVTFEVPNPTFGYIMVAIRFICMIGFYAGVGGVIYSIYTFEAPEGKTEPVSPTVQCVTILTCQFFFVYALLLACLTISEVSGGQIPLETYRFYSAIEAAKATLPWAPMLAILFVTTRMYALLITNKKGAPQAWVQDGMYMATWSLLISFLTCMVAGLVTDTVETDEDGNITTKFSNYWVSIAMTVLRYFTMLLLYGGIITVIAGLFVMTPETANGRGSVPVLSDVVNSTPLGKPPPGPNDVA